MAIMSLQQSTAKNYLLSMLSSKDFAAIAPYLEPVDLPKDYVIATANQPIGHYYFIEVGIGSIVAITPGGSKAEVGLTGRDGILPTAALLGCDTIVHDIIVRVPGYGHRIEAEVFKQLFATHVGLRELLLRFVQALATQTASTALSNSVHHVEKRLARCLLMCHDRIDGRQIALTHDDIAAMLAVRRPSVTTSLHVLEGRHFIASTRGLITIRDRAGLETFAADAYGVPESEYGRLIGPLGSEQFSQPVRGSSGH